LKFGFGFYHQHLNINLASAAGAEAFQIPPQRQAIIVGKSCIPIPKVQVSDTTMINRIPTAGYKKVLVF